MSQTEDHLHGVESTLQTLLAFVKTNVLMEIGVIETLPLQLSDFVLPNHQAIAGCSLLYLVWLSSLTTSETMSSRLRKLLIAK